jgi:signal transduction histidine kinase
MSWFRNSLHAVFMNFSKHNPRNSISPWSTMSHQGQGGETEERCVLIAIIVSLLGLFWVSRLNYLLFHSLAEMYNTAVCWGVFFVAWSGRRLIKNNYLVVLGVASLFIGFLYLIHMLAYKGMGVFPDADANLPTQLWIAARYVHSLAFVAAALCLFYPQVDISAPLAALLWGVVSFFLLFFIFSGIFPDCFIEGQGLTLFKKVNEIATVCLFGLAAVLTWKKREAMQIEVLALLTLAMLLTMAAGLMFILYTEVDGFFNFLGHCCNIGSSYCVFRAFIRTSIVEPQSLLFHELQVRQAALESIRADLEVQVQDRTQKLYRKNKELEVTNQQLNEFAYSISHDLREPLRGMYNFAHFLQEDYREAIDPEGQEMLDTIMRMVQRLDSQILAILKYSRISRFVLEKQSTNMELLVEEVLEELRDLLEEQQVTVKILSPLPQIFCYPPYIKEVLHHLITNGILYNEQQEKTIFLGCQQESTPFAIKSPAPVFYVRDNGIGIPEKHFQKIFGIFRRLHGQDKYGGGLGIGLTLAKQIIERHGGQIVVESVPGQGTTFYFTLSTGE